MKLQSLLYKLQDEGDLSSAGEFTEYAQDALAKHFIQHDEGFVVEALTEGDVDLEIAQAKLAGELSEFGGWRLTRALNVYAAEVVQNRVEWNMLDESRDRFMYWVNPANRKSA